ncbi:MAG: NUDIX domain-containing protein [Candidatus Nomurabacteria bacterium]|jgi:8-oxo-dGTP pyrophosphatase MutT (NUDIX family)|nr:NUDIX domain-containing protein [Candidatus Nomurabacteria bacterium]
MFEVCAKVLLFNEKNQLLILRRSAWKSPRPQPAYYHAGRADIPGGAVGDEVPGEDERTAAVREIAEETGIEVRPSDLKLIYSETRPELDGGAPIKLCYVCRLNKTQAVKLSYEHDSFCWTDPAAVLDEAGALAIGRVWRAALKFYLTQL